MILLLFPTLVAAGYFSDYVEKYVNYSIDPCDDFYDHVCSAAIKDNQFLMFKRKENFDKVLQQLYSPTILEFQKRIQSDLKHLPNTTAQQDMDAVAVFLQQRMGHDCFAEHPLRFLDGMLTYDAYYRLQKTPFYDTLKKKMADIVSVLKEIQIKEFSEAPWTSERPDMLNLLKNMTLEHLDVRDFHLERELEGIKLRYEECMGLSANPSFEVAWSCSSYAVCPIMREMKQYIDNDYFLRVLWTNFTLQNQATYDPNSNKIMPSPMYYTVEDDELPYVLGSVDFIMGHEIGHVFFNRNGVVPSNSDCIRRHMKQTCDLYFNQALCSYGQIGVPGNYVRLGDDGADWAGVHATLKAFKTYFPYVTEKYSRNELTRKFFYGNAMQWCYSNPGHSDNEHSPFKVRINGINSLFAEFSEAFQCKRGSKMAKAGTCLPFAGVGAPTQSQLETRQLFLSTMCIHGRETINEIQNNVYFWNPQKGHHEWAQFDMVPAAQCVIGFTPNCEIHMSGSFIEIGENGCEIKTDGNVYCFCKDAPYCNANADYYAPQAMEVFRSRGLDYSTKCPSKFDVPLEFHPDHNTGADSLF